MPDIPIYVINLDRAPERMSHAAGELAGQGLAYERVPAVDGASLGEAAVAAVHDRALARAAYHVPMQAGEIGCFLSHRRVWEKFLTASTAPFAVILEDDFALQGKVAPVIAALAASPARSWGMVKLWGRERGLARTVAMLAGDYRLAQEAVVSKRTVGQIVSREGAERLLDRALPIRRPIDVQLQYPWELGIEILTIRPSLVVDVGDARFGGSSTKIRTGGFDRAKMAREYWRAVLRADLVARSLARFAVTGLKLDSPS